MPVYDYHCSGCDSEFSLLQPMARSAEPAPCPTCANSATRVIAAPRLSTMHAEIRHAHHHLILGAELEEQVLGFDVPVQDADPMRSVDAAGSMERHAHGGDRLEHADFR